VVVPAQAGERDEAERPPPGQRAQSAGDREAVQAGQVQVQQDGIGPVLLERRQGGGSVVGDPPLVTPQLEQQGQGVRRIRIVINDQDSQGGDGVSRWAGGEGGQTLHAMTGRCGRRTVGPPCSLLGTPDSAAGAQARGSEHEQDHGVPPEAGGWDRR
jgi:hypothetical protein